LFGHFQQSFVQGLGPFLLGKADFFFSVLFADQFFSYPLAFKVTQKSSIGRVLGALAGLMFLGKSSIFLEFSRTSFA